MRRRFLSSQKYFDPSNYMTIEVLEDGFYVSFRWDIEYNRNGEGWKILRAGFNSPILNKGEFISFRLTLSKGQIIGLISSTSKLVNLRGNILSIVFGDNIVPTLEGYDSVFFQSFYNWQILNIEKNFLPATTLANSCYKNMFQNCTSLTTAPELPATTMAYNCYSGMFSGCINLTTAPKLPATTLEEWCYASMFYGCTSLTTAPKLPATTLATYCYNGMFAGCKSLTIAPALPATALATYCYKRMFEDCSKLNYIKMLATNISAMECLFDWVSGVSSTGTFVKNPNMTSLPTATGTNYYSGIPSGWTVINDGEDSGGGDLITFTIDETEYQAEEGMTWGEWVNSEYNVNGRFFIDYDNSILDNDSPHWVGTEDNYVFAPDIIQENYNYVLVS